MQFLRKNVLAIALYFTIAIDGSLAFYLHQFMNLGKYSGSCLLLPVSVMLINLFDSNNTKEFWLALGIGIIADLYFWGIIGIYAVFFPLSSFFCQKIARFLPEVFWTRLLVILLGVIILAAYSWFILTITGLISVSIKSLFASLPLTLFWALIFASATYWLWGTLAFKYPFLIDLNAYK
ncbi:rod shape-determining protein MreD [Lactobacillus sp. ESL0791]|uniref:rod shape-determining protein MreD n=1 Tax=Lactobacillus sp. ESL0791 TaxID=2983234 RepID=UPI0023F84D98|nr:rod shape-determining protein MreD [Lactobacillus sp. ESL0791]MDF7638799.1 rod shape-determining protein MreD [Lactobacillus sp. ESL0791]